jgi:hypothetical protein
MRRSLCVSVILATVAAGVACDGVGGRESTGARQRSIDELAGSYRGVALGDPRTAAIHTFGQPLGTGDPAHPSFADGWPISLKNPPGYIEKPDLLETAPAYCAGGLANDRYIWFGNDPIRVIALSPTSMG